MRKRIRDSFFFGSNPVPVPTIIGELFTRDYVQANYSEEDSPTVVYSPTSLRISGGNQTFSRAVFWNLNIIDCENFDIPDMFVTVNTAGIAPVLLFPGLLVGQLRFYVLCSTGLTFVNADGTIVSGSSIGACSDGDILRYHVSVRGNVFTFTAENISTMGGIGTSSYTYNFDYPLVQTIPSLARMGFCSYTGDYTFSWSAPTTTDLTRCDLYIIGTSKIKGYFSGGTTTDARVSGLWATNNPSNKVINVSGANQTTVHMRQELYLMAKYLPERVLIGDISNNVRFSVATTEADLTFIRDYVVTTLGKKIFIQRPVPEYVPNGGVDLSSLNTIIDSVFLPAEIIEAPVSWVAATDNAVDGVHWIEQNKIYAGQAAVITL